MQPLQRTAVEQEEDPATAQLDNVLTYVCADHHALLRGRNIFRELLMSYSFSSLSFSGRGNTKMIDSGEINVLVLDWLSQDA